MFAMIVADCTGGLQAINEPEGWPVLYLMPFGIWPLWFPMAIDRPKGRLIIVKQIIIIVLWRPFLPGIPRKEEWDIIGEQEE